MNLKINDIVEIKEDETLKALVGSTRGVITDIINKSYMIRFDNGKLLGGILDFQITKVEEKEFVKDPNKFYVVNPSFGENVYKEVEPKFIGETVFLTNIHRYSNGEWEVIKNELGVVDTRTSLLIFFFKNTKKNIKLFVNEVYPKMKLIFTELSRAFSPDNPITIAYDKELKKELEFNEHRKIPMFQSESYLKAQKATNIDKKEAGKILNNYLKPAGRGSETPIDLNKLLEILKEKPYGENIDEFYKF